MNWQEIRTAEEARDKAEETVANVAGAKAWWAQATDYADRALSAALANAEDGTAGTFWASLDATWAGAGDAFPDGVKPESWDKLSEVWKSAAATTGAALDAEEAQSLRTIVSGGLSATVEDAGKVADSGAGALVWVKAHPVATVGLALAALVLYQAAPSIVGQIVGRVIR